MGKYERPPVIKVKISKISSEISKVTKTIVPKPNP
jgi:hypothetical protein